MKKNILFLLNCSMNLFVLNPIGFRKLGHFSGMQNDALMHREGLKG